MPVLFALLWEVIPGGRNEGGEKSEGTAANTACVSEQVTAVEDRGTGLLGTPETQHRAASSCPSGGTRSWSTHPPARLSSSEGYSWRWQLPRLLVYPVSHGQGKLAGGGLRMLVGGSHQRA